MNAPAAEGPDSLLHEIGRTLASELDLDKLVQATADLTTRATGADFGAFFYDALNEKGESYALYALSGAPREAFNKFPMPRNTEVFAPTFRGESIVRSDDVRKDPRYGKNAPHHGMPAGHPPVVSYLAVPVVSRSGEVLGGLFFGHGSPARVTHNHEHRVVAIAAYAAGAIENARLFRKSQEALSERRRVDDAVAHLAAIVTSSDDAIISKSLDGIVRSWNLGAERMFGYAAAEAVGKPLTALIIPGNRIGEEQDILSRIGRGQSISHFETVRSRKAGSLVDISLSVSPIRAPGGGIIGAAKIARDITEKKRVEAELRILNARLEDRVRERTASLEEMVQEFNTFSYTVAHDLRAPLRSIHRYSDVLRSDHEASLSEEGRDFLRRIAESARRMDRLILDLLEYSRVARIDIRLVPIDAGKIAADAVAAFDGEAREKGARVEIRRPIPRVIGDAVLLSQCLNNLLANALKFTAPGRSPEVVVSATSREGRVRIEVRDLGIGIDRKHRDRLFRLFERLNEPQSYPGTGVGLAIVKKAVERMGGTVGVDSVFGAGSCLWIELRGLDS